jgi:CheY-like chemotaxis protein
MSPNRPKLVLIEDDLDTIDCLKRYLTACGVDVLTATSGEEGLALLAKSGPDVACVLVDLKLQSGVSGLEVLRRARSRYPSLRFVVVTGVEDENVATFARGLGAEDYLVKPVHPEQLKRIVSVCLKER